MFRLYFTGGEVDVGKCVELVNHNVDVVGAYAVTKTHYWFPLIGTSYGVKFT